MCTPFVLVSSSTYVDNGIVKVPILAEIRVRVQRSTSEIWNSPAMSVGEVITDKYILNHIQIFLTDQ